MKPYSVLTILLLQAGIIYCQDSSQSNLFIPTNLKEAHQELMKLLPPEEINKMKQGSQGDMIQYHFSIGMWIRNTWRLWSDSKLSIYLDSLGAKEADEKSGIILNTFWRRLNNRLKDDNNINMFPEYDRIVCPKDSSELYMVKQGVRLSKTKKIKDVYRVKCIGNQHEWEYEEGVGLTKPSTKW